MRQRRETVFVFGERRRFCVGAETREALNVTFRDVQSLSLEASGEGTNDVTADLCFKCQEEEGGDLVLHLLHRFWGSR